MSIIEAIILGLVQGLTEFIPVSSSGHLLLVQEAFGNTNTLMFDVMLHVGTLLALLAYFYKDILKLLKNIASSNADGRQARLLGLATLPAVLVGLLLGDFIEEKLRSPYVVVITLSAVAVVMLLAEKYAKSRKVAELSTKRGLAIGFAQAMALIPGVSRSGITITTGMFMGLTRVQAARFSFLLAIPIITGSALKTYMDNQDIVFINAPLLVGLLTAFLSGLIAIKFLLGVIGKVGLKPFAYYRLGLALLVLLLLL